MSVDFEREDFAGARDDWTKIDDVVKARNLQQYLRQLHSYGQVGISDAGDRIDASSEDAKRQKQYTENAIFYNIAGHTLRGLVGTGTRKPADFEPAGDLAYLTSNADGQGNNIHQQVKRALGETIKKGRAGLYVDFPAVDRELSRAERDKFFATIHLIRPERVINWQLRTDGSVVKLSLVVISGAEETVSADGFTVEKRDSLLVLRLDDDGHYYTEKFLRAKEKTAEEKWESQGEMFPADSAGNRLTEIPFTFVGSENNDASIDPAPMLDMVVINIGHYRNSADFEDSVFYAGQTQPYMTGVDEEHLAMLQKYDIRVGSRFVMPVPAGESFGFATPESNPVVRQAMMDKVELMIGLGAKFITTAKPSRTATEAEQDEDVQTSMLSTIVDNVSAAYTRALGFVALFMGSAAPAYTMDSDFSDIGSSPELLAKWVESFLKGAVPESDYIAWMQRQGFFDQGKTAEQISDELANVSTQDPPDTGGAIPAGSAGDS